MMRKIKLVFPIIIILTAIISATLGYFLAYATGKLNMYHSDAMTYCHVLFLQSKSLVREVDSSGVNGLIDTIELNGENWALMVKTWQSHARAEDKKTFSKALESWETAKKKLNELRASIPEN
jgi:hypothetical protein